MDGQLAYIVNALEKIKKVAKNGEGYWHARDLLKVLSYTDWINFRNVIGKAVEACQNSGIISTHHFREFEELVVIGSGAKRNIENFYLSRYACYLIAMNGDASKPEIATAQSYFAARTLAHEAQAALTDEERRLLLRDRVKDANKRLSGAAKDAGVTNRMFGVFHDAGYKGLYGGHGLKEIKKLKSIPENEEFLDCIDRTELAANEFRATQAEQKIRRESIKGEQRAIETHHKVGRQVREAIRQIGGVMPEKLPAAPSIKKLASSKSKRLKGSDEG